MCGDQHRKEERDLSDLNLTNYNTALWGSFQKQVFEEAKDQGSLYQDFPELSGPSTP
jgi:hypothetical protein